MTGNVPVDVVIIAGAIGAALTAVITLIAKVVRAVRRVAEWGARMDARLEYVDSEMRHNGGSTVRDAIARTDRNLSRFAEALEPHGISVDLEHGPHPDGPWPFVIQLPQED